MKFTVLGKPPIEIKKGDFVSIKVYMPVWANGEQEEIKVKFCKVTKVTHKFSSDNAESTTIHIKFAKDSMKSSESNKPVMDFFVGKRMSSVFNQKVTIDPNNAPSFKVQA